MDKDATKLSNENRFVDAEEEMSVKIPAAAYQATGTCLQGKKDRDSASSDDVEVLEAKDKDDETEKITIEEIKNWIKIIFDLATGEEEVEYCERQTHVIVDCTNNTELQFFLTISDTGGCIPLVHGLLKLP